MKKIAKMNEAELSAYIQSHLMRAGINVVLSGGSAVTIYSENKYVSKDLDLVNVYATNRKKIKEEMAELGFQEEARYYTHPETKLFIEFPAGPLAIGEEPVREIVEKRTFYRHAAHYLADRLCQRPFGCLLSLERQTMLGTGKIRYQNSGCRYGRNTSMV